MEGLAESALDGAHACVLCYGASGSGKTHTMLGLPEFDEHSTLDDPGAGILPRLVGAVFHRSRELGGQLHFRVSIFEIYLDEVRDLLGAQDEVPAGLHGVLAPGSYRGDTRIPQGSSHVPVAQWEVTSPTEAWALLGWARRRRVSAMTAIHEHSSRSHLLIRIRAGVGEALDGELQGGELVMVDLAGSERLKRSLAEGLRLREAQTISAGLSALGNVIAALGQRSRGAPRPHVPYRDNVLTRALGRVLAAPSSKVSVICTVSPEEADRSETIATLDFAQRLQCVELVTAAAAAE